MTTATLTITDFLLARLMEDEGCAARVSLSKRVRMSDGHLSVVDVSLEARVLAECEAKRRIVEEHAPQGDRDGMPDVCSTCGGFVRRPDHLRGSSDSGYVIPWPCPTLRALAAVYADHPDYNPDWRP